VQNTLLHTKMLRTKQRVNALYIVIVLKNVVLFKYIYILCGVFGVIWIRTFSQHAQTETKNKEINQIKAKSYYIYRENSKLNSE